MNAMSVDLADQITNCLAGGVYTIPIAPRRRNAPYVDLETTHDTQVLVHPGTRRARRFTRARFARFYRPVVVVARKLPANQSEEQRDTDVDALQALVEQIEDRIEAAGQDFMVSNGAGVQLPVCLDDFDEEGERDEYLTELLRQADVFAITIGLTYTDGE